MYLTQSLLKATYLSLPSSSAWHFPEENAADQMQTQAVWRSEGMPSDLARHSVTLQSTVLQELFQPACDAVPRQQGLENAI